MSPTITILSESSVGFEIANWIAATGTYTDVQINLATCNSQDSQLFKNLNPKVRNFGAVERSKSEELAKNNSNKTNFLITCYWPWLLPQDSFKGFAGNTLNFHPALLPKDKGWYPHVHQIRSASESGVTLHQLELEPDAGNIWVQKRVDLPFPITAGEARDILIQEMIELFKSSWWSVYSHQLTPTSQSGAGNYLTKKSVDNFNSLDLSESMKVEDVLRAIACRNIGRKSFLAIDGTAGKKYIHISFSDEGTI